MYKCIPVDDGINDDLDGISISQQMNDFHGVLDDANSHELSSSGDVVLRRKIRNLLTLTECYQKVKKKILSTKKTVVHT